MKMDWREPPAISASIGTSFLREMVAVVEHPITDATSPAVASRHTLRTMLGGLEACGQAACGSILRSLRANDFRVAAGRAFSAPVLGGSRWIEFLRVFGSLSFEVARGAVVDPTGTRLVVSGLDPGGPRLLAFVPLE